MRLRIYWALLWIGSLACFGLAPYLIQGYDFWNFYTFWHILLGLGIGAIIIGIDIFTNKGSTNFGFPNSRLRIHRSRSAIGLFIMIYAYLTKDDLMVISIGALGLLLAFQISAVMYFDYLKEKQA